MIAFSNVCMQVSSVFSPGNFQGFALVNRQRTNRISTGFTVEVSTEGTQLSYSNFDYLGQEPHYWQLPGVYQGDKVSIKAHTQSLSQWKKPKEDHEPLDDVYKGQSCTHQKLVDHSYSIAASSDLSQSFLSSGLLFHSVSSAFFASVATFSFILLNVCVYTVKVVSTDSQVQSVILIQYTCQIQGISSPGPLTVSSVYALNINPVFVHSPGPLNGKQSGSGKKPHNTIPVNQQQRNQLHFDLFLLLCFCRLTSLFHVIAHEEWRYTMIAMKRK